MWEFEHINVFIEVNFGCLTVIIDEGIPVHGWENDAMNSVLKEDWEDQWPMF